MHPVIMTLMTSVLVSANLGKNHAAFSARMAQVNDLLSASSLLTWDSRTMMPPGAVVCRGHQTATLTMLAREILVSDETLRLLDASEADAHMLAEDAPERRALQQTREAIAMHRRIPAALQKERAELRSTAQAAWIQARAEDRYALFAPYLEKTVELARQLAEAIGYSEHPYDALMSLFEPGETVATLQLLFAELRAGLLPVVRAIAEKPAPPSDFLRRDYPELLQEKFAIEIAKKFGYDLTRGRLDATVHPFEISFTRDDVRITTRYSRNYLPASLFGVLHETGHALYEQGVDPAYTRTPLATDLPGLYAVGGVSFGAHESQSRLWENHVGRSRTFWALHYPALRQTFPDQLSDVSEEAFYRAINRVQPGLIRVEADELTYDFHVMMRTELESDLIAGKLSVAELPEAWNALMKRDLGVVVPDNRRGVLQDIHWSSGQIGTFCNYTIGNVMAAQLYAQATQEDAVIEQALATGDYQPLRQWLGDRIYRHGRRFSRDELLTKATGRKLDSAPYIAYLSNKYTSLYA
jgi:carboxypeptidase Taq